MSEFWRKCGELEVIHTVKCCQCVSLKTVFLQDATKLEGLPLCVPATESCWILRTRLKLRQNNSTWSECSTKVGLSGETLSLCSLLLLCCSDCWYSHSHYLQGWILLGSWETLFSIVTLRWVFLSFICWKLAFFNRERFFQWGFARCLYSNFKIVWSHCLHFNVPCIQIYQNCRFGMKGVN